ncbi:MAG: inner membrane-spanning protein YciB [Steroidobacteraceae bacterium]
MPALLEYLPLVAFGIAYWLGGLYVATATIMIAMTLTLAVGWKLKGKLPKVSAISTALVLVFGAATLILRNAHFIQWKPSVFLWLLGAAFLASAFIGDQPLAQRLLQPALGHAGHTRRQWLVANTACAVFLAVAGAANLAFAYHYSEAAWVRFKLFGLPAAMFVFLMLQLWWLHSRSPQGSAPEGEQA